MTLRATRGSEATPRTALLERLAAHVRARRKARALTLRELAGAAGVSERFLALLESGRANVSVARLDDIARALDTSAAALLTEEPAPGGAAPDEAHAGWPLVALLGLRGSGKSAIGARAAARLGLPFHELDALVAERAGMSLGELFELHGAGYYRRLEREEVDRLVAARAAGFLATGGGLVTDHETFGRLRRSAVTIWLKARPDDHYARVLAQGDGRPMADRTDAMRELRALLRARRPLYELADHVVDTSALGLGRSVERVVRIARQACSKRSPAP
jgi:XRE family aerobic/anaerobic benzoate catabolism transcriptional regulator